MHPARPPQIIVLLDSSGRFSQSQPDVEPGRAADEHAARAAFAAYAAELTRLGCVRLVANINSGQARSPLLPGAASHRQAPSPAESLHLINYIAGPPRLDEHAAPMAFTARARESALAWLQSSGVQEALPVAVIDGFPQGPRLSPAALADVVTLLSAATPHAPGNAVAIVSVSATQAKPPSGSPESGASAPGYSHTSALCAFSHAALVEASDRSPESSRDSSNNPAGNNSRVNLGEKPVACTLIPFVISHDSPVTSPSGPLLISAPSATPLLSKIKLLVFDFDGVMSDNRVLVMQDGSEGTLCNRSDGLGIGILKSLGLPMLVLSKETNPVVSARCKKLKIECLQGIDDKLTVLREFAATRSLVMGDIAYVGNDINDLGPMSAVGVPIAVADAYPPVLAAARLITHRPGGHGAVREVCDALAAAWK